MMQTADRQDTQSDSIELSVLIPAFNAASFLPASLSRLGKFLTAQPYHSEIIVIDDGSHDETSAIAQAFGQASGTLNVTVARNERNQGKGSALVRGLRSARGRFAVILDADLEYPPHQIASLLAALQRGADLAVANRQLASSRLLLHRRDLPHHSLRYVIGRILNVAVRALLLPGIEDTQAGLKGLRMESCRVLADRLRCRRFGVDVELLLLARERGLRIAELPVLVESHGDHSTIRLASDSAVLVRDLALIMMRSMFASFRELTGWHRELGLALSARTTRLAVGGTGTLLILVASAILAHFHLADAGGPAMAAWLVAIGGMLLLGLTVDSGSYRARRPRFASRSEAVIFVALLLLVTFTRLYELESIPPMMHGDSAECAMLGRAILAGRVADIFDFSPWYNTPFISFVPYAASLGMFGLSILSVRLPSAVISIAAAIPLYFLIRPCFGRRVAQMTIILFAFSHPILHFSRSGLWNIQAMFYQLLALALLLGALRRRSALLGILAGLTTGMGLYSYTATRIIPVIAVVVLAFAFFERRRKWPIVGRIALPYLAAVTIAALPLALNYVKKPEVIASDRTSTVSVLGSQNREGMEQVYGVHSAAGLLLAQTERTLKGFTTVGDASGQYGTSQPIVSPFSLVFLLIGVALAVWRIRQLPYFLVLAWLVLVLFLGSVMIIDPPSYTRLVGVFPVICALIALGVDASVRLFERWRLVQARDVVMLCGLVMLQAAAFDLVGYHNFNRREDVVPREWDVLKVMATTGRDVDYYLFTGPFLYDDHAVFRLFAEGARTVTGFSEVDIPGRLARDTVFVLTPEFRRLSLVIQEQLPGAELEVLNTQGRSQLFVYRCTLENACRRGTT